MDEVIDITACLAKGKIVKVEDKEYEVKFGFRAILELEKQYGTVGAALDSFIKNKDFYNNTLNFLYAALGEKYKLKKTDIEEWISISTAPQLHDTILEALLLGFGTAKGESEQGEA